MLLRCIPSSLLFCYILVLTGLCRVQWFALQDFCAGGAHLASLLPRGLLTKDRWQLGFIYSCVIGGRGLFLEFESIFSIFGLSEVDGLYSSSYEPHILSVRLLSTPAAAFSPSPSNRMPGQKPQLTQTAVALHFRAPVQVLTTEVCSSA